ncbi:multidrug efflux pump subunit AcrB [Pontibacter ummariensis]|uniref:Multidrug efflux pump subunit AcrB n=1 Tax=Pontibacter ummariensis TaxID=1610492 RepID=A0A239L1E4_9BACT|nr:efflux RND transporter permease subunit [Pontibacter ummariensis]PRY04613.1 multidrug efflux pump subunit AcrB [Pontibacter ummariensis]SNT24125.1 Multidrug efflux pump subunit AcrB [Pontibacter ummariensis]
MKEFKPTSWSIDNRTSIYIVTIIITLAGIFSYINLQKENFPDIVIPTVFVATVYPGTSPVDMENLVTRPIEKEIKALNGVKEVSSNSVQDFSMITVEFNTDVEVAEAKQLVKDAVDKARAELPTDLPQEPDVQEVNFSEIPIMYVNVSGNYSLDQLKQYAEDLQDRIEGFPEITRVDMIGALDKEVQVNVDMYKMQAAKVTFTDIERAIASENVTVSGGNITVGEMKRSVRVAGQYADPEKIAGIVIKSVAGGNIRLGDIAEVKEGFEEQESYARLDNAPVITLNVIKRSGENLIEASDKIREVIDEMEGSVLPEDLTITITGDQSKMTRHTLNDLINTIIIGFVLVTVILMFFMGTTNALFVGLSVPISMFLAFILMPTLGFSLNMIVLFSFLLALGIVVDDAIVVIENTHRIYHTTNLSVVKAAKAAAGEVFVPVLAGTLTTVAPFLPLAFWPGVVGKFMFFLPITLIITLMSSLLVAFIINPVFAVSFMKKGHENEVSPGSRKIFWGLIALGFAVAIAGYVIGWYGTANLAILAVLLVLLNKYVFTRLIDKFQHKVLPRFMSGYESLLRWMLVGWRPIGVFLGVIALLIFSLGLTALRPPQMVFFPSGDPNFVYTYINMPIGTDQAVTDSVTKLVEQRVYKVIGADNPDVESVISNVAIGAGDQNDRSVTPQSHKGKVTVAFVEYKDRVGATSTAEYLNQIREAVKGLPGVNITVDKEQSGPPVGKPISVEIAGEDFDQLVELSKQVEQYIEQQSIGGIEELRSDLEDSKPEILVNIDRERANREGISTGQIGQEIRTAIFGKEASTFKRDEDEYPIQVRYAEPYRDNIDALLDMRITYRDMNTGLVRQIPLSSVADIEYTTSYGGIKRSDLKRMVTLESNVLNGYNPNEVVQQIETSLQNFQTPEGFEVRLGGQQEEQQETMEFLMIALVAAFLIIFLILVTQFNSVSKPFIILSEVLFSIIGVLLGFSIFGMDASVVMTGVGIVALAGIVVKNGILIVEFTDILRGEGVPLREAIVEAGKTRLNPVLLTATATILGLIPLAIGLNLNFYTLFTEFEAGFFLGGDSAAFWGPLAWTIIFGLAFATIITLLVVPVMYLLNEKLAEKINGKKKGGVVLHEEERRLNGKVREYTL